MGFVIPRDREWMRRIAPFGGYAHRGLTYRDHRRPNGKRNHLPNFEEFGSFTTRDFLLLYNYYRQELEERGRWRHECPDVIYRGGLTFELDGTRVMTRYYQPQGFKSKRFVFRCPRCNRWCRVLYRPPSYAVKKLGDAWRCQRELRKAGVLYRIERWSKRRKAEWNARRRL